MVGIRGIERWSLREVQVETLVEDLRGVGVKVAVETVRRQAMKRFGNAEILTRSQAAQLGMAIAKAHGVKLEDTSIGYYLEFEPAAKVEIEATVDVEIDPETEIGAIAWARAYKQMQNSAYVKADIDRILRLTPLRKMTTLIAAAQYWVDVVPSSEYFRLAAEYAKSCQPYQLEKILYSRVSRMVFVAAAMALIHYPVLSSMEPSYIQIVEKDDRYYRRYNSSTRI